MSTHKKKSTDFKFQIGERVLYEKTEGVVVRRFLRPEDYVHRKQYEVEFEKTKYFFFKKKYKNLLLEIFLTKIID
jgi:hypothetical protein